MTFLALQSSSSDIYTMSFNIITYSVEKVAQDAVPAEEQDSSSGC
jgi:hypothetical protein